MAEQIELSPVGGLGAYALSVRDSERVWQHFHECYCVTLVTAGLARWRYRRRDLEASVRGAMLMEPGEVHVNTKIVAPGSFFAVFVPSELLGELFPEGSSGAPHFRTAIAEAPRMLASLRSLQVACSTDDVEGQEESLLLALSEVLTYSAERVEPLRLFEPARVHRGRALLEERYRSVPSETVDVRSAARDVGMSYFRFVHCFRAEFGLPPYRFVQSLRVARVHRLLKTGPSDGLRSLRDVAMAAGYADASHMSREFRRDWGLSPKQFALGVNPRWGRASAARAR